MKDIPATYYINKQKGFSGILILIGVAAVIGVLILGSFLLTSKKSSPSIFPQPSVNPSSVPLTKADPIQPKVGTAECPELDYTGCDTSGNFATWDGQ